MHVYQLSLKIFCDLILILLIVRALYQEFLGIRLQRYLCVVGGRDRSQKEGPVACYDPFLAVRKRFLKREDVSYTGFNEERELFEGGFIRGVTP